MIADPIEETFPFAGHTEFLGADGAARLRAPRAQRLARRLSGAARRAIARRCARPARRAAGALRCIAPTGRRPQALLALRMRLEGRPPARAPDRRAAPECSACRSPSPRPPRSPLWSCSRRSTFSCASRRRARARFCFRRCACCSASTRRDQTPHRTPWPLLLLRLAHRRAAIILAMAGPIWNAARCRRRRRGRCS